VSFDVQNDKSSYRLQGIVDNAPEAKYYYTDGNVGYLDVIFPGKHKRNVRNKNDTHTIESINADLRHYIFGLARSKKRYLSYLQDRLGERTDYRGNGASS
jgi:IS1 family transposase